MSYKENSVKTIIGWQADVATVGFVRMSEIMKDFMIVDLLLEVMIMYMYKDKDLVLAETEKVGHWEVL